MHAKVASLLGRNRIQQHTNEWYRKRRQMITASHIAPILGISPFMTAERLFLLKTGRTKPWSGSYASRRGLILEPEALKAYTTATGNELIEEDVGLVTHEKYPFFGASPDGVCKNLPILIEVKCPLRRKITHSIPKYYYSQVQWQMYCCNLRVCHFVQYRPNSLFEKGVLDILQVEYDPGFIEACLPKINHFWASVTAFYEGIDRPIGDWTTLPIEETATNTCTIQLDDDRGDEKMAPVHASVAKPTNDDVQLLIQRGDLFRRKAKFKGKIDVINEPVPFYRSHAANWRRST